MNLKSMAAGKETETAKAYDLRMHVLMQSCDGTEFVRSVRIPSYRSHTHVPSAHVSKHVEDELAKMLLFGHTCEPMQGNFKAACVPLFAATRKMLGIRVRNVHLSNTMLLQGGMQPVPNLCGLVNFPLETSVDLHTFKTEVCELTIASKVLKTFPAWVSDMTRLVVLDIRGCNDNEITGTNTVLLELPESLGCMPNLIHLKLLRCAAIRKLPISLLSRLQTLQITSCKVLSIADTAEGSKVLLHNMQSISLEDTSYTGLPCFHTAMSLQHIRLRWMPQLSNLPVSLCWLDKLTTIILEHLPIATFPASVSMLTGLTSLCIAECSQFRELPPDVCVLTSLKTLSLHVLPQLRELPQCIGSLAGLHELSLEMCSIHKLPSTVGTLFSLTRLSLLCPLEDIPMSIENLVALRSLTVVIRENTSSPLGTPFKTLAGAFPSLRQLEYVELSEPTQNDILSIGRSLKAWPLPCLKSTNWRLGFKNWWSTLSLPSEGERWDDSTIMQYWQVQQHKFFVFTTGLNTRLGSMSPVSTLDDMLLLKIADELLGVMHPDLQSNTRCV